jgi:hypothetical protein
VRVESAGLLQKLVNEGGFAMVNVSDDGNISEFFYHRIYLMVFKKNRVGQLTQGLFSEV